MSKYNNAIDAMANSFAKFFDEKSKKLHYDKTFRAIISEKVSDSKYLVSYTGRDLKVVSLNGTSYSIGDKVLVTVPCNDWDEMFVVGRVG